MHDCYGRSALWYAVEEGSVEAIDSLLQSPSDMHVPDENGVTPFMRLLLNDKISIDYLEKLLEYDFDINAQDCDGLAVLWYAVIFPRSVHYEQIRLLLEHGANPNLQHTLSGNTILFDAATRGMTRVIALLLEYGADENLKNSEGVTPLHVACHNGSQELVELLLKHNAHVYARDSNGETPFVYAARNGHSEIIQLLGDCAKKSDA